MSMQIIKNKFMHVFEGNTPILLEMPHSGQIGLKTTNGIPPAIASKIRFRSKEVRRTIGFGCDAAVPSMSGFYNLMKELDLSAIYNDLARVYCDTNRGKDETSNWVLEGSDSHRFHHGVIWGLTLLRNIDLSLPFGQLENIAEQQSEKMLESPLTKAEFNLLTEAVYDPYHAFIGYLHKTLVARHGFCIHLALHSLPPISVTTVNGGYICGKKAKRGTFDPNKKTLPDVILIHNDFKTADSYMVNKVRNAFESAGLIVEDGQGPFTGDKTGVTKIYGHSKGVYIIGIEHVTHDIETARHLGDPAVNIQNAKKLQPAYKQAVINLLK